MDTSNPYFRVLKKYNHHVARCHLLTRMRALRPNAKGFNIEYMEKFMEEHDNSAPAWTSWVESQHFVGGLCALLALCIFCHK